MTGPAPAAGSRPFLAGPAPLVAATRGSSLWDPLPPYAALAMPGLPPLTAAGPAPPAELRAANRRRAVLLAAGPSAVIFLVLGAVGFAAGGAGLAVALAVAGWVAGWAWCWFGGRPLTLWAVGAERAAPGEPARVRNLLEGLCAVGGMPEPELAIVHDAAPDALVVGRGQRHVTLVVTRGLVDLLSRVELEGVLAHEMSLVRFGDVEPATVSVAVLAPWRLLFAPVEPQRPPKSGRTEMLADLRAVSLTRYPPGLISALEKIEAAPPRTAGSGRAGRVCSGLWFRAGGSPMTDRIEALSEL